MKNRWQLTEEVKQKYLPIVQDFINKVEAANVSGDDYPRIDFSDTELNPYTLQNLLEGIGYDHYDTDTNGWEMDFWINMTKNGFTSIVIEGSGITFRLELKVRE